MKRSANYLISLLVMTSVSLIACESHYEKCKRHYIDKEGYTYEEACDQCDAEEDAYIESTVH